VQQEQRVVQSLIMGKDEHAVATLDAPFLHECPKDEDFGQLDQRPIWLCSHGRRCRVGNTNGCYGWLLLADCRHVCSRPLSWLWFSPKKAVRHCAPSRSSALRSTLLEATLPADLLGVHHDDSYAKPTGYASAIIISLHR